LAYQPAWDESPPKGDALYDDAKRRQQVTLDLAKEFLARHKARKAPFQPLGVAQGWSPRSYARSVQALQKMGYRYIAVGGMVPLKTTEILSSLQAIDEVRQPNVHLHLLGVTRIEQVSKFARCGVVSFDSTSPLRQAFKDDKDNYYTMDRTFTALRVPQVEANPSLLRLIKAGEVSQPAARKCEQACLVALRAFDEDKASVDEVITVLREYETLYDAGGRDHSVAYRETLDARPWTRCACDVCIKLGHHVALFRGAERNRRRGFHNVWIFYRRLRRELGLPVDSPERDVIPNNDNHRALASGS
jgi:hypothetical protein